MALVAEEAAQTGVEPLTTLSSVLPTDWYSLHKADHMVDEVKASLREKAPQLWRVYEKLSNEDRAKLKIL